jgi:sortase A
MVREGVDDQTLQRAVGHIPSTPLPGQKGNIGLAGHRDTFFHGLKGLEPRDEIRFSTHHGDFRYRVEQMMIVEPANVGVLAQDQAKRLTIVTCYPFNYVGNAPKRFVVRATQIQ